MKVLISWCARLFSMVGSVLLIRQMVILIGVDGYAALCVLISAFSWFVLLDLGIGFSLQNYLSEHRGDQVASENLKYTAGLLLVGIGVCAVAAVGVFHEQLAALLFGSSIVSSTGSKDVAASLLFGGALSVLAAVGTSAAKIWYAEHRGFIPIVWSAMATAVALCVSYGLTNFGQVVSTSTGTLIYFLPMACVMGYALLVKTNVFAKKGQWSSSHARKLVTRGRSFWLFALAAALTLQVDNLILAHHVSAENLVTYNVAIKIAYAGLAFYSLALGLLHPVMTESLFEKRSLDVSRRVTHIIAAGVLFCVVSFVVFFPLSKYIFNFIAPGVPDVSRDFKVLMFVYILIRVWSDAYAIVLMSASKMDKLIISTLLHGLVCVALMIFLVPGLGINGILISYIASYLLTNAWYSPYLCKKLLDVGFSFKHIALPRNFNGLLSR